MTRREKRRLWLLLPEVGSLRIGFVSKRKDGAGGDAGSTLDDLTVESSVVSSRYDVDVSLIYRVDDADVRLRSKLHAHKPRHRTTSLPLPMQEMSSYPASTLSR